MCYWARRRTFHRGSKPLLSMTLVANFWLACPSQSSTDTYGSMMSLIKFRSDPAGAGRFCTPNQMPRLELQNRPGRGD